jgi:hypothetical protein
LKTKYIGNALSLMTVAMHFFINILDADAERGGIPSRENTNLEKNPGIYPIIIFDK